MKSSIKALLDLLKELIPETNSNRQAYNNMRLIPVPAKSGQDRKIPNPNNTNR
jgi:hypothetical protein